MNTISGRSWKLVFGTLALALGCRSALAQEVVWRDNYEAARLEAQQKGLPLVLDIGTAECFWCRKLAVTTFRDPRVIEDLNAHFIPLKVEADQDGYIARSLRVGSFPTVVIAAPDGHILARQEGYVEPVPFYQILEAAHAKSSPPIELSQANSNQGAIVPATYTEQVDSRILERSQRAKDLVNQALETFRAQQFLNCLEQCDFLTTHFGDLPEGQEAGHLAEEIKSNAEWMRRVNDTLTSRQNTLYLALADGWVNKGQPDKAVFYLERVAHSSSSSSQAKIARQRLEEIRKGQDP